MMLGGTLCWAVYVPILQHHGVITRESGFDTLVPWTLWGGAACMVTSGLFSFALQWRSVVRAMGNLRQAFTGNRRRAKQRNGRHRGPYVVVPCRATGLVGCLGVAGKGQLSRCPTGKVRLRCRLAFLLALVACRVTGGTDNTPVGAMGQTTQLIFGGISPAGLDVATKTNVTLMSANITAAAAGSAADLLTDLKSGYLLGATPPSSSSRSSPASLRGPW